MNDFPRMDNTHEMMIGGVLIKRQMNGNMGLSKVLKFIGYKEKERISKRVFQENKVRQNLRKTNILNP